MTVQLDRGIAALKVEFKDEIDDGLITSLGTFNCRRKNNTADGPWSEHSWPNAVDVMLKRIPGTATPTPEANAVGFRVAKWMREHPELWSEVFWQVAAHFDHPHGTANPRMNFDNKQVPPCAGGPEPQEEQVLQQGDSGNAVRAFQTALKNSGRTITVDGVYGAGTKAVVIDYQQDADLEPTGMIDGVTASLLVEYLPDKVDTKPAAGVTEAKARLIAREEIGKSKNVAG